MVIVCMALSIATFGLVLTLLYREERGYADKGDLAKLSDHVASELGRLQASQSQLYRYVEAVDAHTGANGHRVLRKPVRGKDSTAR